MQLLQDARLILDHVKHLGDPDSVYRLHRIHVAMIMTVCDHVCQAWPQPACQADKKSLKQRQQRWVEAEERPCARCPWKGKGWRTQCLACLRRVCDWCLCYHESGVRGASHTTTAHSLCSECGGQGLEFSTAVDENWSMRMVKSTDAKEQQAQEGWLFWCVDLRGGDIFQWWRWVRSVNGPDATTLWGAAGQSDHAQHAHDGCRRVLHFSAAMPSDRQSWAMDRNTQNGWGFLLEVEQDEGQSTSAWFFVYIGHRRRVHHLTGGKPHLRWLPVPDDWARIGRVILSGA